VGNFVEKGIPSGFQKGKLGRGDLEKTSNATKRLRRVTPSASQGVTVEKPKEDRSFCL